VCTKITFVSTLYRKTRVCYSVSMVKTATKGVRLKIETWELLEEISKKERRTNAEIVRFCVEDHLEMLKSGLELADRDRLAALVHICSLSEGDWKTLKRKLGI